MRHLFILNPVSGGMNDKEGLIRTINEAAARHGAQAEIYETVGPMDAAEKVKREAIKGQELRVYACGGDGTLSECVHGAAGYHNVAVTHFPTGTGNDFIKSFPGDTDLFRNLDELLEGTALPLDVIDVNGRKCIDIASVGIDARVGTDVHKYSSLPLIGGKGAYITSLVVNIFKGINRPFTFTTEEAEYTGKFALCCACNGRFYGNGFNPTTTALPDDGLLDILIVKKVGLIKLAALLGDYSKGDYAKHPDTIIPVRGRKLHITSEEEFVVNIDGEAMHTKDCQMKLIPGGVNFIMPASSAFLKERIGSPAGA